MRFMGLRAVLSFLLSISALSSYYITYMAMYMTGTLYLENSSLLDPSMQNYSQLKLYLIRCFASCNSLANDCSEPASAQCPQVPFS